MGFRIVTGIVRIWYLSFNLSLVKIPFSYIMFKLVIRDNTLKIAH